MSTEPVGENAADDSDAETVDRDLVRDLVVQLNSLQDRVDELEDQLQEESRQNEALRAQNKKFKKLLAGNIQEFGTWNPEQMRPIHPRLVKLEEKLDEHEDKFEMFVVEEGKTATPDERALHLRQVMYNKAKRVSRQLDDPTEDMDIELDRDECTTALGADLARSSIIDAMKRAADGSNAGNPDKVGYTPIQGSSDLQPVGAIQYESGRSIGSAGGIAQSTLGMSTGNLTGVEARKIPTTVGGGEGGS